MTEPTPDRTPLDAGTDGGTPLSSPPGALRPDDLLPDDRRDDPPPPASATVEAPAAGATEADREARETVRSISRLDESN